MRVLFTKGIEALPRENLDYAITLFNQVLEKEPGFFDCRKALRDAQFRKAGDGGTGFFKKMLSGAGSSPEVAKAKMALGKNPAEALAIAEQILNGDPNSSAAHRIIVDAAKALELPHTAVLSYETLVEKFAQGQKSGHRIWPRPRGHRRERRRAERNLMELLREMPGDGELKIGAEESVRPQDDGRGRLWRAGRRHRLFPRHFEEQGGGRLAGTGKARSEIRGRDRAAHRRIRGTR